MSPAAPDLGAAVQQSWLRFLDVYEPLRPDLYRYCRHLTRSPWDAEDMAQDTLARAYVTLGCLTEPPPNPRAWLFRVASNLWLNRLRQARETLLGDGFGPEPAAGQELRAPREAAGTLLAQLSPQERAAVVLKDVFELSLAEVAEALSTSTGAIKAALHRGRSKLSDPEQAEPEPVAPAVLDAFCEAFNARDLDRLIELMLESSTLEFPGVLVEYGADALRAGSLHHTLFGCPDGQYLVTVPPRAELRVHRGQYVLLWWLGDRVDAVVRAEVEGERIARLKNYRHAPELASEVCAELGVPVSTHGYRPTRGAANENQ
jgi:RNA polymerase sigma-70 factor (ECF subfamily)